MSIENLDNKLKELIKLFTNKLYTHCRFYNESESVAAINERVNKKLAEIFKNNQQKNLTLDQQYHSILLWCLTVEDDISFKLLKDHFKGLHEEKFNLQIQVMQAKQVIRLNQLQQDFKSFKSQLETDIKRYDDEFNRIKQYRYTIEKYLNHILGVKFNPNMDSKQLDNAIHDLKKVSNIIRGKLKASASIKALSLRESFEYRVIKDINKKAQLDKLDDSIKQYQAKLDNEPWYVKAINFFSPARRRRKAAIKSYTNEGASKVGIGNRFQSALKWLKQEKTKNSDFLSNKGRFSSECMCAFQKLYDQYRVESLPCLQDPMQLELDTCVNNQHITLASHNEKMSYLRDEMNEHYSKSQELHEQLLQVINNVNQVEEIGAFGFARNGAEKIQQSMNDLQSKMTDATQNKNIDKAKELAIQISNIKVTTPIEQLNSLAVKAEELKNDRIAAKQVEQTIGQVINDTLIYGGKVNNQVFMGKTQAERVVTMLGTEAQKVEFQTIKKLADERAKETFTQLELDKVVELRRGIETGGICDTLTQWRLSYLKHKNLEGYSSDPEAEAFYQTQVKQAQINAASLHKQGKGELKAFIDEVMDSVCNASHFNVNAKRNAKALELLSVEQADILITIYGDNKQYEYWTAKILPEIKSNKSLHRSSP